MGVIESPYVIIHLLDRQQFLPNTFIFKLEKKLLKTTVSSSFKESLSNNIAGRSITLNKLNTERARKESKDFICRIKNAKAGRGNGALNSIRLASHNLAKLDKNLIKGYLRSKAVLTYQLYLF